MTNGYLYLHFDMEKVKSNAGAKSDPEEHLLNYCISQLWPQ